MIRGQLDMLKEESAPVETETQPVLRKRHPKLTETEEETEEATTPEVSHAKSKTKMVRSIAQDYYLGRETLPSDLGSSL